MGVGAGQTKYAGRRGPQYLKGEARQDAIDALKKVHGVYDKLLFSNLIAEESKSPFEKERARLSAFIQRVMFKGAEVIGGTGLHRRREGRPGTRSEKWV